MNVMHQMNYKEQKYNLQKFKLKFIRILQDTIFKFGEQNSVAIALW